MAAGRSQSQAAPLLLQKISLSPFQRTHKHFSSDDVGNGFLQFFRLSLGRRDGGTGEGWNNGNAVCKCRASERAIPPLLKTRNEIQLTNCFLAAAAAAAAAAFVSRQTGGGTEERCEGTKFAFGARNSV